MANNQTINVLMLGAKRAGKSTLLASLVESIVNGPLKNYIHVEDATQYLDGEETLKEKVLGIQLLAKPRRGTEICPDSGATNAFKDYTLEVYVPGSKGKAFINFTDGNGEFLQQDNKTEYKKQLEEKISTYDVILVAIDTPFLMEAVNSGNRLCKESTNKKYNQIPALQTILTEVNDGEGKIAKQILFVPIKCEKWLQEGRFHEVVERVKSAYDVILCNLSGYSNIEIGVLPVQTVGNIVFSRHRTGYILSDGKTNSRCSYVEGEGGDVILSTGEIVRELRGTTMNLDSKMQFGSMIIPYSWFRVVGDFYRSRNCDMLAYHILRFVLAKTLDAKQKEAGKKSGWSFKKVAVTVAVAVAGGTVGLMAMWAFSSLVKRFGSLKLDKLQKALQDIKDYQSQYSSEDKMYVYQKSKLNI